MEKRCRGCRQIDSTLIPLIGTILESHEEDIQTMFTCITNIEVK